VPWNPGTEGGIILTINDGERYCATFGGSAGGNEVKDTATIWKIVNPPGQGCPSP
jgi:hypothetical protein